MIYSISPLNAPGKDNCAFWDGFLTNDQINEILSYPEWLSMTNGRIKGEQEAGTVDHTIRNSRISWLNLDENTQELWSVLSDTVGKVNSEFFQFNLTGMYEPIQLSLYSAENEEQGHYSWHTDMNMIDRTVPRKLSMSLLLSDPSEFEGGELQVKTTSDEEITLDQEKGRAWFFPSWVLHRVTPVTKGVRRSLVLWVGGPAFK
jgi:PKHD-type hydroxylase